MGTTRLAWRVPALNVQLQDWGVDMRKILCALTLCAAVGQSQDKTPALDAWLEASANLERDASSPSANFAARVEASTKAVRTYYETLTSTYAPSAADSEQVLWMVRGLSHPEVLLGARPEMQRLLESTAQYLTSSIATFSREKDASIQQVRQAMERERAALKALTDAIDARTTPVREVAEVSDIAETLRASIARAQGAASTTRSQLTENVQTEARGWDNYYRDMAEGAAGFVAPSVSSAATPSATSGTSTSTLVVPPAKPIARPSNVPTGALALPRYAGSWAYTPIGTAPSQFFGPVPKSVTLTVTEADGKLVGTLQATFTKASYSLDVQFGDTMQPARVQRFATESPVGPAIVELIPGPAFNLLELNVRAEQLSDPLVNVMLVKQ
jgi:hypothetical protein